MLEYSLISDMHVDHPQPKTPYDQLKPLVLVAGDTGNGLLGLKFLNKLKNKGHTVVACEGNHEHYSNVSQDRSVFQTESAFYKGLNQLLLTPVADDLVVICTNGWYVVEDEEHWQEYMNDSRLIGIGKKEVNLLAQEHAERIDNLLSAISSKAIVMTHTAPCYESLDPKYEGSSGNPYYVNPFMTPLLAKHADKIAVWHHGHTHASVSVVKDGVSIITNPRGYPRENPSWQPLALTA